MKKLRAFLGVEVSDFCRDALVKIQDELTARGARLKLVERENIHVTLKFLGDVDVADIAPLQKALAAAVKGTPAFDFEVASLGAFPNAQRPRVVFAGIKGGAEGFEGLFKAIEAAAADFGVRPEGRRYTPHITLARVKDGGGLEDFIAEAGERKFSDERAASVVLFESRLGQDGPTYTRLAEFELTS